MFLGISSLWPHHIDKCNAKVYSHHKVHMCLSRHQLMCIRFRKNKGQYWEYSICLSYEASLFWWQLSPHVRGMCNHIQTWSRWCLTTQNERYIKGRCFQQSSVPQTTNPALTWQRTENETRLKKLSSDPDPDQNAVDSWFWPNYVSESTLSTWV